MSSSGHLEHQHDDFGFDPEFTDRVQGIALWFYRKYWRVEVDGIRNVPARGRALLAANHAGIVPYDGAMIRAAIIAEHPKPRHARMLVVDWAFAMPFANIKVPQAGAQYPVGYGLAQLTAAPVVPSSYGISEGSPRHREDRAPNAVSLCHVRTTLHA